MFLTAVAAEETEIEASFREAIRIAREQKSISLAETRRSNLRKNTASKKRAGQADLVPTTAMVTAYSAVPMGRGLRSDYPPTSRLKGG